MTIWLQQVAAVPRAENRLGFGLYLIPGFPDWDTSEAAMQLAVATGVDFIEFPILLDYAMSKRTGEVVARSLRQAGDELLDPSSAAMQQWVAEVPVPVGVVYASAWPNPHEWRTPDALTQQLAGLICEHDAEPFASYANAARKWNIPVVATVRAGVTVATKVERDVLRHGGGFIYLALGQATGQPIEINETVAQKVRMLRAYRGDLPIYAAFGIRSPDDLAALGTAGCDGFIVGSHALRLLDQDLGAYRTWLHDMADARREAVTLR